MFEKFHRIPLLALVVVSAAAAIGLFLVGADFLTQPISIGETQITKSLAAICKDSLFLPLKPLMYALVIMSIGSSLATNEGGLGRKLIRVISYFALFLTISGLVGVVGYSMLRSYSIFPDAASVTGSASSITKIPFGIKIYGVLTSALMVSIYAGILFGKALKARGLGKQAEQMSDLFMRGFRKFLQYTIPLAVFGSITLALNREGGIETLTGLWPLLFAYLITFGIVWITMVGVTAFVLKQPIAHVLRAVVPQAIAAISTSSSIATLPATKTACQDLGANAEECTPFFTIGATINMAGTLIGMTLLSLYAMADFGLDVTLADQFIVAFQSLIYSVSAAGVPSASIVLIQDILTSQGVSAEYATFVTGLIITLDTLILDRMRTVLNTQSDSMSTVLGLHQPTRR